MREFLKLMGEELLPSDVRDLKYLLQDSLSGKLYLILRFFGILKFSFLVGKSSRPEVFCKKGVLRNFVKLTEKHLCQSLLFNKVAGLRPLARVFSCEFGEISKNTFCYRIPLDASRLRECWSSVLNFGQDCNE